MRRRLPESARGALHSAGLAIAVSLSRAELFTLRAGDCRLFLTRRALHSAGSAIAVCSSRAELFTLRGKGPRVARLRRRSGRIAPCESWALHPRSGSSPWSRTIAPRGVFARRVGETGPGALSPGVAQGLTRRSSVALHNRRAIRPTLECSSHAGSSPAALFVRTIRGGVETRIRLFTGRETKVLVPGENGGPRDGSSPSPPRRSA